VPAPRDRGVPEPVRLLQERAARALPAEMVQHLGTWWLRHAPGCAWWVGSVLPHGEAATRDLPHLVAAAEGFYGARDVVTAFQVCPGACADVLDTVLEARGYRRHTPMSLQAAPVAGVLARNGHPTPEAGAAEAAAGVPWEVQIEGRPGDAWWTVWQAGIHAGEGAVRDAECALLARVEAPSAYATAAIDGEAVSIARAVADTGWAGVFDVVTLPHARGKGAARAVLSAVAGWAQARGCQGLYLQVERDNAVAHRLYGRVGFVEMGRYHYRELP
jgi:N-acetylglutamate synthase